MKKQIILSNGCTSSVPAVTPSNWKTGGKELLEKDWRIQFYFKDPAFRDVTKYKNGKQVRKKGMNVYKTLEARREATQILLDAIHNKYVVNHYNPITEEYMSFVPNIDGESSLMESLKHYLETKQVSKRHKMDINSMLKYLEVSIFSLGIQYTPIKEITRRNIRSILAHQQQTRGLSNNRYNKYKSMLSSLFDDMIEDEVIEHNPTYKIKNLQVTRELRVVLTDEERRKVYVHLKSNYYTFWRFMMLFYSSGARISELMNLQVKDIDLSKQEFKVFIKKGRLNKWVAKPINKNMIHLWKEIINEKIGERLEINADHYLFSRGLVKGDKPIDYKQITRRWKEHVKKKLGIEVDFYAFKHLYADQVSDKLDIAHAQRLSSHTSDRMMKKHYAVNEEQRKVERLKNIDIPLYTEKETVLRKVT